MFDPRINRFADDIKRLTSRGLLGFFTNFEAIEVFATLPGVAGPVNVFSLFVADERDDPSTGKPQFPLKPMRFSVLKGWAFRLQRTLFELDDAFAALRSLAKTGSWIPADDELGVGTLTPSQPLFVPGRSRPRAPWNNVLKNNFWAGSYVLELVDAEKNALRPLFDAPRTIQELSERIQPVLPLQLASLSDRLGHIVFQVPSNLLVLGESSDGADGTTRAMVRWHPKATPRPLQVVTESSFERAIDLFDVSMWSATEPELTTSAGCGRQRTILRDPDAKIIIASIEDDETPDQVTVDTHTPDPEPRLFCDRGAPQIVRVHDSTQTLLSSPRWSRSTTEWTSRRMYKNEVAALRQQRRFVQYHHSAGGHGAALLHIRELVVLHGQEAAWLWDPYLSAEDLIATLFYCPHKHSDLRGLTAAEEPPGTVDDSPGWIASATRRIAQRRRERAAHRDYRERQLKALEEAKSNFYGLRMEFRRKTSTGGWGFHDRFLIFPKVGHRALAWSLGASVNSGTCQRV